MEPTASARAMYLPPLLHHAAFQPDQRGRKDALREREPSGPPGWELSLRGAQLGAPNATGCPACRASYPLEPQHPLRDKASRCACPLRHTAGTGKGTSSAPPAPKTPAPPDLPEQPCSGVSTRSTSLRGEGTSSARLGVLAPAAGTKAGAGTHVGVHPGSPLPSEACRMCTISPICSGR